LVAGGALALCLTLGLAIGPAQVGASSRRAHPHAASKVVVLDPATGRVVWSGTAAPHPWRFVVIDPATGRVIWPPEYGNT
jgi:hypothetical protein